MIGSARMEIAGVLLDGTCEEIVRTTERAYNA